MAIALITNLGVASASSATTLTFTSFGVTLPAGTLITLAASINTAADYTVIDNSSQPGTANAYAVRPRLTTGSATIQTCTCVLTRPILSTNSIILTWPGVISRRTARLYAWSGANATPLDKTATAGTTTNPLTVGPTATLAGTGELAINFVGWAGAAVTSGVVDNAGFTAVGTNSGGITTRTECIGSYKLGVGTAGVTDSMTFSSGTVRGEMLTFKVLGTAYTQGVSGAMSFVGSTPRPRIAMTRRRTAALSFVGARTSSPTARLVQGGFAPTGSLAQQQSLVRTLTAAALSFLGVTSKTTSRALPAAGFTPTGATTSLKSVSQALVGALTFSGSESAVTARILSAILAPAGALSSAGTLARTLTVAVFAPVGSGFNRLTTRLLPAASVTPTGDLAQSRRGPFTAALSFAGGVSLKQPAKTLYATLSFTTSMTRFVAHHLFASLVASGVLHTRYIPPTPPTPPGGGGFGALMSNSFFQRYQVSEAWRHMRRVKPGP